MPIVICLPMRPKSINSTHHKKYRDAIASAARQRHLGSLLAVPLYSRIIWFHKYVSTQGDIDNIPKGIHDALKGAIFVDDRLITHTMAIRVDATVAYEIANDPANPNAAHELLRQLDLPDTKDVLYIEIGEQLNTKIQLGPPA